MYPEKLSIYHPGGALSGDIHLSRSKSISNRVLIIRALSGHDFPIHHLSESDDTRTLEKLLSEVGKDIPLDAHHAGTTYRFMTAYLATRPGTHVLTGSSRMKERPIKALVDALLTLGAQIDYLEKEGYPPLTISNSRESWKKAVSLPADISSQYISALMMIGPTLPEGLTIQLIGELVSRPYLEMTSRIMEYFGAQVTWKNQTIEIAAGNYRPKPFTVEADWSAASYFYAIAAMAPQAKITLHGLHSESLQGDAAMAELGLKFGITTTFLLHGAVIEKNSDAHGFFEYNFIEQPDLTQTLAVMCAGLNVNSLYSGLKTLRIKETDRIDALQKELAKFQVFLSEVPTKFAKSSGVDYFMQEGNAQKNPDAEIQTYRDHRMAMAFAPLALRFPLIIDKPGVVSKSYPGYWEDLATLGFVIEDLPV